MNKNNPDIKYSGILKFKHALNQSNTKLGSDPHTFMLENSGITMRLFSLISSENDEENSIFKF